MMVYLIIEYMLMKINYSLYLLDTQLIIPSDKSSDDSVCWADKSQTLLKISLRCLSRKNTIVVLCFGEVIDTSMSDAYELAKKSANSVSSSLSQL